jgi:hypothetical protein
VQTSKQESQVRACRPCQHFQILNLNTERERPASGAVIIQTIRDRPKAIPSRRVVRFRIAP